MDGRWSGLHGIGRYASEVIGRMGTGYAITSTRVPAASRLDPWWLQRKLRHLDADMFFSPGFNVAASRLPQVVVIHDLIHLRIPEESSRLKTIYYERLVKPVILRTGAVVTVSDGVSRGEREDASGDLLAELLAADGFEVERRVVPDERDTIASVLQDLAAGTQVVLTTGGTPSCHCPTS